MSNFHFTYELERFRVWHTHITYEMNWFKISHVKSVYETRISHMIWNIHIWKLISHTKVSFHMFEDTNFYGLASILYLIRHRILRSLSTLDVSSIRTSSKFLDGMYSFSANNVLRYALEFDNVLPLYPFFPCLIYISPI